MFRRTLFKSMFLPFLPMSLEANPVQEEKYHPIVEWAEKNFYITNMNKDSELIKLYPYQKRVLTDWMSPGVIKTWVGCRQSGKTTMSCIHARYMCEHEENHKYALFCNTPVDRYYHKKLITNSYSDDSPFRTKSKTFINAWGIGINNSTILFMPYICDAVRGYRIHTVAFNEHDYADTRYTEELHKCVMPCLLSLQEGNGKIIASSSLSVTQETVFKRLVDNSNTIYTTWNEIPGRTNKWKNQMLGYLNNDSKIFNREYENRLT